MNYILISLLGTILQDIDLRAFGYNIDQDKLLEDVESIEKELFPLLQQRPFAELCVKGDLRKYKNPPRYRQDEDLKKRVKCQKYNSAKLEIANKMEEFLNSPVEHK